MCRRALTLLVLVCLAAPSAVLAAAPKSGPEPGPKSAKDSAEVRTLREEVSEASAEEASLLDRLDAIEGRRRPLDARVAALDRQLASLQAEVDAAEERLAVVQGEFVRAQTGLTLAIEDLAAARNDLRGRAVAAYVGSAPATAAELVLRAGSLREVATTVAYLESVVQEQRHAVHRYAQVRDGMERLREPVEARKEEAKAQRDVVVGRRSALESGRAEQQVLRQAVLGEQAEQERLVGEVRARKTEFEARIAALQADSSSLAGLLQGVQAGRGARPPGSGVLSPPIPGALVSSGFGPRLHPIFGTVRMHDGLDYRAVHGTPIRAAAAGTVVSAGPRGGYGNATVVDHGGSLATLVAHQSAFYVVPGAAVAAGQVIGAVGSTGFSTGPHLHFEVRVNGTPADPLLYL